MNVITQISSLFALFLFLVSLSFAQPNVDLVVAVHVGSESARGGEPFSFSAQVTNRGTGKATDVILLANPEQRLFGITSAVPQRGTCEEAEEQFSSKWRCRIGDIAGGEAVTIAFAGKMLDIDEESSAGDLPVAATALRERAGARAKTAEAQARIAETMAKLAPETGQRVDLKPDTTTVIGRIWAAADVEDRNDDDNTADVKVEILPSRNKPPQVAITNPKADAVLVRPARKPTSFEFTIEAFDPDGTIEKVVVLDPKERILPVPAPGHWEFIYHGTKYTAAELEKFLRSNPQPESLARRTEKNTYSYVVTNPAWGRNQVYVTVTDNGGRTRSTYVDFFVRGDATVEIISPKPDQIVEPGSTLTVETVTTLKEGPIKEILLVGDVESETYRVPLQLVSKNGNVYRHRYVLKNVRENSVYSGFHAVLVEDSGAITESKGVSFLPRRIPIIKFANIRNGQVFNKPQKIEMQFSGTENGGMNEHYELLIDGKYRSTVFQGFIWHSPEPGTHTIEIVIRFFNLLGPEIGRSERITVHVQ